MITKWMSFDLKYGYLVYASISVAIRATLMVFLYFVTKIALHSKYPMDIWPAIPLIGWFITAILVFFLAIAGIIQDLSTFVYPYIVILFVEVFVYVFASPVLAFMYTPLYLFGLFGFSGIYCFDAICVISLCKTIKPREIVHGYQNDVENNSETTFANTKSSSLEERLLLTFQQHNIII